LTSGRGSLAGLPIARPSKILCAGRNYRAHAAELGSEVPPEPLFFLKAPSSLLPGGSPIVIPPESSRVDYEGEIAFVVGKRCRNLREEEVWDHLESVLPLNDVTARDLQRKDLLWTRAKGFDTFCPVGVPVPLTGVDVDALEVVTRVNGEERQRGRARDMVYPVPALVSWISRIMTLEPGDLIATGTPEGIGPLAPGDTVEVEIPGIGSVRNRVEAPPGAPVVS